MRSLLEACSFDDPGTNPQVESVRATRLWAPLVGVFLVLVMLVLRSSLSRGAGGGGAPSGSVTALGQLLFTDYLFPFEVTSLLLLVAIVGVMALTKRKPGSE